MSGIGSSGNGPTNRTCGFTGRGEGETAFGVTYSTAETLDVKDVGTGLAFAPLASTAVGEQPQIAKGNDRVVLQTFTNGVRLTVSFSQQGLTQEQLQEKVIAATKVVIETLPAGVARRLQQ